MHIHELYCCLASIIRYNKMPIKTLIIYCLNSTDQSIIFDFHQVFHILSEPSQSIKPECKISDSQSGFPKASGLVCSVGWQILNISENHVPPLTVQDEGTTNHQNKCNNLSDTLSNPRSPASLTQTTPTDRVQPELYTQFIVIPVWYIPNQGTFLPDIPSTEIIHRCSVITPTTLFWMNLYTKTTFLTYQSYINIIYKIQRIKQLVPITDKYLAKSQPSVTQVNHTAGALTAGLHSKSQCSDYNFFQTLQFKTQLFNGKQLLCIAVCFITLLTIQYITAGVKKSEINYQKRILFLK